jgi:phenol 2-monooxygenase
MWPYLSDACHTHSSGSAQGLNTGSHDAINLAWKLSLALKGLSSPKLMLGSYAEERKQLVQKVIDNDSIIATLISGNYPEKYKNRTGENTRDLLTEWCENAENKNFTLGLSVAYGEFSS